MRFLSDVNSNSRTIVYVSCRPATSTVTCDANLVKLKYGEIGILLPNKQRHNRTLHIQKDVLPCALC